MVGEDVRKVTIHFEKIMEKRIMEFQTNIFEGVEPPSSSKYNLIGTKLPTSQDVYFVSKWHELFERYEMARIFLSKTEEDNWDYWFDKVDDEVTQKGIELMFKAQMLETALINYNILVDLTWTMTYVSAEYVLYKFDNEGNVTNADEIIGMHSIEKSLDMLRKTENGVSTPHAEGNPFQYLKVMRPEFSDAIDLIIEFWKEFSESNIRNTYNYIKHKGTPCYKEIEALRDTRFFNLTIGKESYPTDIRDVRKVLSIDELMDELRKFDNEKLYPYVARLIEKLKIAVSPSPMII